MSWRCIVQDISNVFTLCSLWPHLLTHTSNVIQFVIGICNLASWLTYIYTATQCIHTNTYQKNLYICLSNKSIPKIDWQTVRIHTYIHTYTWTSIHTAPTYFTCIHTYMQTHMHTRLKKRGGRLTKKSKKKTSPGRIAQTPRAGTGDFACRSWCYRCSIVLMRPGNLSIIGTFLIRLLPLPDNRG